MLPSLKIKIDVDTAGLQAGFDRATERLNGFDAATKKIGAGLQGLGTKLTGIGAKASILSGGIAAISAGLFAAVNASAAAGNAIDKTSKAVGLSAEAFQEWGFAVGQVSDLSEQQLGQALRQLATRMGQAADGSKPMIEAFEAIGISQADLASGAVGTDEALRALVARVQSAATPAEAMAIASRLLGEEAGKLGTIFRESGDQIDPLRQKAHDLGVVMSGAAVTGAADFTDKMDEVTRQMAALRDSIAADVMPVLTNTLIPALQESVIPALRSVAQSVGSVIEWFGNLPGPVQEVAGVVAAALGAGGPIILAVGLLTKVIGGLVLATGPIGLLIGAATLLTAAWSTWGEDIKAIIGDAATFIQERFQAVLAFFTGLPEQFMLIGTNIVQGIISGIDSAWEGLMQKAYEMASALPMWVKEMLGIHSPSTVFAEIGTNIVQGLAQGIGDSAGLVAGAIQGVSKEAEGAGVAMTSNLLGSMKTLFKGSKEVAILEAIINTIAGATRAFKDHPFPLSAAVAATVMASGFANVAAIQSTGPGGGGGGRGGAAAAGAAAAPAQAPLDVRLSGFGPNDMFTGSQLSGLFDKLQQEAGDRGLKFIGASA
jgi:hypothetical protein